jgi:hypothetical protein
MVEKTVVWSRFSLAQRDKPTLHFLTLWTFLALVRAGSGAFASSCLWVEVR